MGWLGLVTVSVQAEPDAPPPNLDLGTLKVSADRWTYDQEVLLRMIWQGYEAERSPDPSHINHWVCWIHWNARNRSNRSSHLRCARNGDLAVRDKHHIEGMERDALREAGYGTQFRSLQNLTRGELEGLLDTIPGDPAFNDEFLVLYRAGQHPPIKVPSDDELQQYVASLQALEARSGEALSRGDRRSVVQANGLGFERWTLIGEMVALFPSVRQRCGDACYPMPEAIRN